MSNYQTIQKGAFDKIREIIGSYVRNIKYKKIIKKKLLDRFPKNTSFRMLDIGCGTGIFIRNIFKTFERAKIYGIDNSYDMVTVAKRLNKKNINTGRVTISQGEVTNLSYEPGYFELVTLFNVIDHIRDIPKMILQARKVLNDNGILLIVNDCPKRGSKNWNSIKFHTEIKYTEVLNKYGFKNVETEKMGNTIIVIAKKH